MTGTGNSRGEIAGENPGELSGAYALNALNPDEAAGYEAHLARSEQARIEAAELSDTAATLGNAVAPVQPSAALKASLMARLATTPQLPPVPVDVLAAPVPPDVSPTAVEASAPPAPPAAAAGRARGPASERARRRWFRGPVGILVAAAAAVALFVGGAVAGQTFNADQFSQQQAAGLAQINSAPDSQRASATTADGHKATLVWSAKRGLSALLVDDLPALPSDRDYQLWYIGSDGPVSAGTFDSSGTGTVWRVLEGAMTAGDVIGVTVEPKGGSAQPTTDPIVAIQSS
jgi:anti-sigma-K factor RskA